MATFVTDSTVLTPGLLGQGIESLEPRLLVLCAYGRLTYYEHFGAEEVTNAPEFRSGNELLGRPVEEIQRMAGTGAAALAEQLPHGAPADCLLVLSTPILDRFEESLMRGAVGAALGNTADLAALNRRAAAALVAFAPAISPYRDVPVRTGLPDLDVLLETAAQVPADFVVSDSARVGTRHGEDFQLRPGTKTRVCSFESFVSYTELDRVLDDVDPSLLHLALAFTG